jgi:hypothetical protein
MAKKINFSSVQKQANVEVIELNTYFIAKTIKALSTLENAMSDGVHETVSVDSGKEELKFTAISSKHVQKIYEEVLPFLKELEDGFMSDSKE